MKSEETRFTPDTEEERPEVNAKRYLSRACRLERRINVRLKQVSDLRDLVTQVTTTFNDMPRSDSPDLQRMETTIVKIVDLEREMDEEIDRLVDLKREIADTIATVSRPEYREVLELRYLCDKDWHEIAEFMHYSDSHTYRIHGRALKEIEAQLTEESSNH